MRRVLLPVVLFAVVGTAAAGYAVAQDPAGTPEAESELCATPAASPTAAPAGTPGIDTDASPAAVATEVMAGIEGSLDEVVCATPAASPPA